MNLFIIAFIINRLLDLLLKLDYMLYSNILKKHSERAVSTEVDYRQ